MQVRCLTTCTVYLFIFYFICQIVSCQTMLCMCTLHLIGISTIYMKRFQGHELDVGGEKTVSHLLYCSILGPQDSVEHWDLSM
jgi:hypothetical protein